MMHKVLETLRSKYRRSHTTVSIIVIGDATSRESAVTLRSIRQQTCNPGDFEIILVDTAHAPQRQRAVSAVASENLVHISGGQLQRFAALQLGVKRASGTWCVPMQSGETLDPEYLRSVMAFISTEAGTPANLLLTRPLVLDPETNEHKPPRGAHDIFRFGTRLADLNVRPEDICLPHRAIFQTKTLTRLAMRHCDLLATFGYDYVIGMYLSQYTTPTIGIIAEAHINTTDIFSISPEMWHNKNLYADLVEKGYKPYLELIHQRYGFVPKWAQICVLNYVLRYFNEDRSPAARTAWLPARDCSQYLAAMRQVFSHIEIDTVRTFCVFGVRWIIRESLVAHFYTIRADAPAYYRWQDDHRTKNLALTVVRHRSNPPLQFEIDGERTTPIHQKVISHTYFGMTMAFEYVLRLPPGERLTVYTDDQVFQREELVTGHLKPPAHAAITAASPSNKAPRDDTHASLIARASSAEVQQRYRGAWMLIDRPNAAGDNAEHLYRYLMHAHPDIACYFVLKKESPAWSRLVAEGFTLIDYDSDEALFLAANARLRVSSDASDAVLCPRHVPGIKLRGKFVFLQHGVLMHDLSSWLNPKPIDLMITSTQFEYDAIAGDFTPYRLSSQQVALTGLPRFDALERMRGSGHAASQILVMPTWRKDLVDALANQTHEDDLVATFNQSQFGTHWLDFLAQLTTHQEVTHQKIQVVVLLHPLLRDLHDWIPLPQSVHVKTLDAVDLATELARSHAVITDYSSIAFDAAYLDTPVIYFQPHGSDIFDGSHTTRRGAFTYEQHGMGPVARDTNQCLKLVSASLLDDAQQFTMYRRRAQDVFAFRDANNCERVVATIHNRL